MTVLGDLTPEVQTKVKDLVTKFPCRDWTPTVNFPCSYNVLSRKTGDRSQDGFREQAFGGEICHAGIRDLHKAKEKLFISSQHPEFQGKYPEFTKWVNRESPFAHGVLNQDNDDEILNKALVIDGALVDKGGMLWLGKVNRYSIESEFTIPLWMQLREKGLDGLQAFIGASILDSEGNPRKQHCHCSVVRYASPKELYDMYLEWKKSRLSLNDSNVRRPESIGYDEGFKGKEWGSVKTKEVSRSDGWGGYIKVRVPADPQEYVEKLQMIFKGDYRNVG